MRDKMLYNPKLRNRIVDARTTSLHMYTNVNAMDSNPASQSKNGSEFSPAARVAESINDGKKHLLLAASGSVATIKIPLIISALADVPDLSIRVVLSESAAHFLEGQSAEQPSLETLQRLPNVVAVHRDRDEWDPAWTRGASILHIELRRWAHLLVVAPMSANLLAKATAGICDSLLTCVMRAWDTDPAAGKKILLAPAMNTSMWNHPLTARQLATLRTSWGAEEESPGSGWVEILLPQSKALACGDVGQGAMCDWQDISQTVRARLGGEE